MKNKLISIPDELFNEIVIEAEKNYRTVNKQIVYMLTESLTINNK